MTVADSAVPAGRAAGTPVLRAIAAGPAQVTVVPGARPPPVTVMPGTTPAVPVHSMVVAPATAAAVVVSVTTGGV